MEDIQLLDTIERYLNGQMLPEEKMYFQQLRKNTPEIDQMVVEHRLFLQQMNLYAEQKSLQHTLDEVHNNLAVKGDIYEGGELNTKGRVIQLWNKYKRITAIAASIAGVTALAISFLVTQLSPAAPTMSEVQQLSIKLNNLEKKTNALNVEIKKDNKIPENKIFTTGGTGFLIDGKGYLVTNAHVLKGSGVVVINKGQELSAKIAYIDEAKDLAILKIDDSDYKPVSSLPYSIKKSNFDLGEEIYTLGYPRDEIVYNMGYLSAITGYNGDTASLQISLSANPGNSGGPVLNKSGEIVGVLSTKETQAEGVVFAIKAKGIYQLLDDLKKQDTTYQNIKIPSSSILKNADRVQQIKEVQNYVYQIKVYN